MALLGWSYDDNTEMMSRDELVERFTLERVGKSAAVFDYDKLEAPERPLPARAPPRGVRRPARRVPARAGLRVGRELVRQAAPLVQEKIETFGEFPAFAGFFFARVEPDGPTGRRGASRGGRERWPESSRSKPERSRRRYAGSPSGSGSSRATRFSPFAWRSPGRRSRPASSRASSSSAARSRSRGSQAAAAAAPAGRAPAETPARTPPEDRGRMREAVRRISPFLSDKTVEGGKQIRGVRNCRPAKCRRF